MRTNKCGSLLYINRLWDLQIYRINSSLKEDEEATSTNKKILTGETKWSFTLNCTILSHFLFFFFLGRGGGCLFWRPGR